jgi:transposase
MRTAKNRGRYDRRLGYLSDLTDDEWAHVEPLIPPAKRGGNKRHVEVREVMNGIMYILSTGCQWRAIPKDLPPRSTLLSYLDLWSTARWIASITRFMWSVESKANEKPARAPPSSIAKA